MGPQYVNVCEVNHSSGSTYVTNWGFPEADQFVHRGSCHGQRWRIIVAVYVAIRPNKKIVCFLLRAEKKEGR